MRGKEREGKNVHIFYTKADETISDNFKYLNTEFPLIIQRKSRDVS